MIIRIPGFFAAEQAAAIIARLSAAEGASPSGIQGSADALKLGGNLRDALVGNPVFEAAALPRRISDFSLLRLTGGDGYAYPLDVFVAGTGDEAVRADLCMTLFLNGPDAYRGGELAVLAETGTERIRMDAGSALIYPATNFHRVEPVTAGERWTAEAVIQSTIREDAQRQILAEITSVLTWIDQAPRAQAEALAGPRYSLRRARANLGQMWSEV